ncbi:hypothetical protein [Saccharothrix texasensis]|uniref:hypothetical protein n=1 Tax=Saccharothrix texasensis TaxID=103734 RepID=UPI000F4B0B64|nr:hypothetical protein [Saccharothrix texasensis]
MRAGHRQHLHRSVHNGHGAGGRARADVGARAAAVDLGAPAELVEDRVAEHGLLVPAALLGTGGWPALWRRAHR